MNRWRAARVVASRVTFRDGWRENPRKPPAKQPHRGLYFVEGTRAPAFLGRDVLCAVRLLLEQRTRPVRRDANHVVPRHPDRRLLEKDLDDDVTAVVAIRKPGRADDPGFSIGGDVRCFAQLEMFDTPGDLAVGLLKAARGKRLVTDKPNPCHYPVPPFNSTLSP